MRGCPGCGHPSASHSYHTPLTSRHSHHFASSESKARRHGRPAGPGLAGGLGWIAPGAVDADAATGPQAPLTSPRPGAVGARGLWPPRAPPDGQRPYVNTSNSGRLLRLLGDPLELLTPGPFCKTSRSK